MHATERSPGIRRSSRIPGSDKLDPVNRIMAEMPGVEGEMEKPWVEGAVEKPQVEGWRSRGWRGRWRSREVGEESPRGADWPLLGNARIPVPGVHCLTIQFVLVESFSEDGVTG